MTLFETKDRKVLTLFPPTRHHLAMEAIIDENCEGTILVDDTQEPGTAAVWCIPHEEATLYLAGFSNNSAFNEALKDYFTKKIGTHEVEAFEIYPAGNWENLRNIFEGYNLLKERDSYYSLNSATFKARHSHWEDEIPEGFTLERVESRNVFEKAENIPIFANLKSWKSFEKFKEHGFGYYLVEDETGKIVSGCKTKFVTASQCEIGIETDSRHRRKGFATLVASATIGEALEKGLQVIWEVWQRNSASIQTNQCLGFDHLCDADVYYGILDELERNLYFGFYYATYLNDLKEAAFWFKKGIAVSKERNQPISSEYNVCAARVFAAVKEYDLSLECLDAVMDKLDAEKISDLLRSEVFNGLRDSESYRKVVERLELMKKGA